MVGFVSRGSLQELTSEAESTQLYRPVQLLAQLDRAQLAEAEPEGVWAETQAVAEPEAEAEANQEGTQRQRQWPTGKRRKCVNATESKLACPSMHLWTVVRGLKNFLSPEGPLCDGCLMEFVSLHPGAAVQIGGEIKSDEPDVMVVRSEAMSWW